jgi:hypothetical protein
MPAKLFCQKCGKEIIFEDPKLIERLKETMTVADFEGLDLCAECTNQHFQAMLRRRPELADEIQEAIAQARQVDESALLTLDQLRQRLNLAGDTRLVDQEPLPPEYTDLTVVDEEPLPPEYEDLTLTD